MHMHVVTFLYVSSLLSQLVACMLVTPRAKIKEKSGITLIMQCKGDKLETSDPCVAAAGEDCGARI